MLIVLSACLEKTEKENDYGKCTNNVTLFKSVASLIIAFLIDVFAAFNRGPTVMVSPRSNKHNSTIFQHFSKML